MCKRMREKVIFIDHLIAVIIHAPFLFFYDMLFELHLPRPVGQGTMGSDLFGLFFILFVGFISSTIMAICWVPPPLLL